MLILCLASAQPSTEHCGMQGRGDQENVFSISAEEWEPAQSARDTILGLVEVPEAGKIYK